MANPPASVTDATRARVQATRALAAQRWRIAAVLTVVMVCVYFGFIALVAYDAPLLASLLHEGLSLGILLGALVIVMAWVLTFIYVSWANRVYDPALAALREQHAADGATPKDSH
jgi:uncharacterized membrane protein (DUF485 family)